MTPSQRLAELGLELPPVPEPLAAYVPAVTSGEYVWTSGQLPMRSGALVATGKVGESTGLVTPAEAKELARLAALNALAAIAQQAGGLDRVVQVVKVVGFVASDAAFTGQPGVINGASELIGDVFDQAGVHARSAVGVAVLPLDAPVEVEVVARVG